MLVYATAFPTGPGKRISDFLDLCHRWLSGSPHYPLKDLPTFRFPEGDVSDLSRNGHGVLVAGLREESRCLAAVRHSWTEMGRQTWLTDVIACETGTGLAVSVNLSCEFLLPGSEPPVPRKPYIIKLLFRDLGGGKDCDLVVQDRPHMLRKSDVGLATDVVLGRAPYGLPIVYVSADFGGRPSIDIDDCARRLSGLAHVIVEPDRYFSIQLARLSSSQNPYGGAVGLYWPGSREHSYRLLPNVFRTSYGVIEAVEHDVRTGWLFWRAPGAASWAYIYEGISVRRLNDLRERGSQSLEEFASAFDQENQALREQLKQSESKVLHLEHLLALANDRRTAHREVSFAAGKEPDLFQAELRDAILRSLQEDLSSLSPGSRRALLLQSFLDANEITDSGQQLEEQLKEILGKTDRVDASVCQKLEDLGFTISDGGKHYKAVFGDDPRMTFTLFKTASDFRAGKNLASEIVRQLLKR